MASFFVPEGYTLLNSEIYHVRPGETMTVPAVGGVLTNDSHLPGGTVIDYYTAFFLPDEFTPDWDSPAREFVHGSFALGELGEFIYRASLEQPDYQYFEIFFYWIHSEEDNYYGMIEFIVQEDSLISHQTSLTALHKADFSTSHSIVGEAKVDTLILSDLPLDAQDRVEWSRDGDILSLSLDGCTITADGIERLQFSSGTLAFDVDGHAGQAYRLYKAAFGREPDDGGLRYWVGEMDRGTSLADAAAGIISSQEFDGRYGTDPFSMIPGFYLNILGREPQAFEIDYWLMEFADQSRTMTDILIAFSESPENVESVAPALADAIWIV